MKIDIQRIAEKELKDKISINNSILRFQLRNEDGFLKKLEELLVNSNDPDSRIFKYFLSNKTIKEKGNPIKQMAKNLRHNYLADYYYTNGQNIVSLVYNDSKRWEIGNYRTLFDFINSISTLWPMTTLSFDTFKMKSFIEFERAENYIAEILNFVKILKISTTNGDEYSIQACYPNKQIVNFNNGQIKVFQENPTSGLDWILENIDANIDSDRLQICLTCKHFGFSGMSHDMSGGTTGYCHKVRNKLEEKSAPEQVTQITNICSKFELKE